MADLLLELAVRAAYAGAACFDKVGDRRHEVKTGVADLVTEADRQAERKIISMIRAARPDADIIGEEGSGGSEPAEIIAKLERSPEVWVIDPLDGTSNFVHGFPGYAVSIACVQNGQPYCSVVFDPLRDEMFNALRNEGSGITEEEDIGIAPCDTLKKALLATGFHWTAEGRAQALREIQAVAPHTRNMRCIGSAALHLAWVACGRLNGFWQSNLNPWDIVAGALLVMEAGGTVTTPLGDPYTVISPHIVASAPGIHDELVRLLSTS